MEASAVRAWITRKLGESIELRQYQLEAWRALWSAREAGKQRALIHLATGLGKTLVAAVDIAHFLQEEQPGARVLFISHMRDISGQAQATFQTVNPAWKTAKFRRGKHIEADIVFTTFQAIHKRLTEFDRQHFDYIIWDEAHHIEAETFKEVRDYFTPQFELGLTATPERADGRDIYAYFGHALYAKSLAAGIAEGWLSAVDYKIVFDDAVKQAMEGGFQSKSMAEIRQLLSVRVRNEVIAQNVRDQRHAIGMDNAKTIVFCQNTEAAEQMATLLDGQPYHTGLPKLQRRNTLENFRAGNLQVICTVDMFNEGIDIPDARLIVFLRSTSSRTIFEQQLGRGLRRHPKKKSIKVLDFVANVERINFVRDLGHTISAKRGELESYQGLNTGDVRQASNHEHPALVSSHFEFEELAVSLMEKYQESQIPSLPSDHITLPTAAKMLKVDMNTLVRAVERNGGIVKYYRKPVTNTPVRAISKTQFNKVASMYKAISPAEGTVTVGSLAVELQVGHKHINERLNEIGITPEPHYYGAHVGTAPGITIEESQRLRDYINSRRKQLPDGYVGIDYIVRKLGISIDRVNYYVDKVGLDPPPEKYWKPSTGSYIRGYSPEHVAQIETLLNRQAETRKREEAAAIAAYRKYRSATKAANALGVSNTVIYNHLKRAGIKERFYNTKRSHIKKGTN